MSLNWDPGSDWTYRHYLKTIRNYQESGYFVGGFQANLKSKSTKKLILRHDVDFNFETAFSMARFESQNNIQSSYFFRLAAAGYNLLSVNNLLKIKEMSEMKHEISLHVDHGLSFMHSDETSWINFQLDTFQNFTGIKIHGVSSHEPARNGGASILDKFVNDGLIDYHAYETRFVVDMKYISDSTQRWREKSFEAYINQYEQIQVLIHPIWWHSFMPQESY